MRVGAMLPAADVTICNTVMLPIWLKRRHPRAGRVVAVIARMPKGQARFYGNVDLLLSLSASVSAALIRENPRLASRIAPFPFPIDWALHARAAEARSNRSTNGPLTLGYVGRVHPEKGLGLLLEAAVRLQSSANTSWKLLIAGPTSVPSGGRASGPFWSDARK
jgi:glycosyltransferase involved in cell wall biosynthesis